MPLRRALDALLFAPSTWFCIDVRNVKVPGVTPGTLEQALALVGRGRVATVVGQLRAGVAGVDVDAAGAVGDAAAEALRDWCIVRGLWHLLRPSGGGPGRWHLFVVPGVHHDDLAGHVERLRAELGLSRRLLDVRAQLRPLSAPHRRTGTVSPIGPASRAGCLDDALTALRHVLEPLPASVADRRASAAAAAPVEQRAGAARAAGGPGEALTPLPRPRRDLPAAWAAYLEHGRAAAARLDPTLDRDPTTRSQIELEATWQLVLAGYTEPEAWAAISVAHADAFCKARGRGRRWWWHTWNRCVFDADEWLRSRRAAATTGPTKARAPQHAAPRAGAALQATQRARATLEAVWRSWPARTRHTDVEVLTTVLQRMDRVGTAAVAIPQRDLVLDCAVASRTTVRAALTRLQAAGLLSVVPTYQAGTTDTAHTLALPDALLEQGESPEEGSAKRPRRDVNGSPLSLTDPSWCQPPQLARPRPLLALRRGLGLTPCAVLRHLPAPEAQPTSLPALAHAAGLLEHDQHTPSPRQLRTLRGHLRTLAEHGLARVDEHGSWHATPVDSPTLSTDADAVERAERLQQAGQARDDLVRQQIAVERTEFRNRLDPQYRAARWEQQRHLVLARAAKAARARQKAWWTSLPPDTRERRRTTLSAAFKARSPADQDTRKQRLAEQRARIGEHEPSRYAGWLAHLSTDDLQQRSLERAAAFAARPEHEQQQLVAAWAEHRARWHLPHHRRGEQFRPGPGRFDGPSAAPEVALLQRTVPDVEELVLFDVAALRRRTAPRTRRDRRLA